MASMKLEREWHETLRDELTKPYVQALKTFLEEERQRGAVVYPSEPLVFNAFLKAPLSQVRVVIVGQDPYHGAGQAHGLSFSVPPGVAPPPSLRNIFQELYADLGLLPPDGGCLTSWAEQGILLLNVTLTVRQGEPRSHYGKGWEPFTDAVIARLMEREEPLVFLLWGKTAQEKYDRILSQRPHPHAVLRAAHPSPYSVSGFFGCRHFSQTNAYLSGWGKEPIQWGVPASQKGPV